MREPNRSLDPPDSFVYTGPMSTAGRDINRFALSLKVPANREAFLRDADTYMRGYKLPEATMALVRARDWTGLIKAGGHLQAVLKIAATVGQNLWHIGAHNAGVPMEEMLAACPRKVGGLPKGL
jgi:protocatechuate 4,5-dioxygenase, alpha chain